MEKTITIPFSEYRKTEKHIKELNEKISFLTKNTPKFSIDNRTFCFIDPEIKNYGRPSTNYIKIPSFTYDSNLGSHKEGLEYLKDVVDLQSEILDGIKKEVFELEKVKREITKVKPNFWNQLIRKR